MSYRVLFCSVILTAIINYGFSQSAENKRSSVFIKAGATLNTLRETNGVWHGSTLGYEMGILTRKKIVDSGKLESMFGISYQFSPYTNYQNSIWDQQLNRNVNLQTSFNTHEIIMPLVIAFNFKKMSVGLGVNFSYMVGAKITQISSDDVSKFTGKYDFKDKETTAPFSTTNLGPILYVGYKIKEKVELGYAVNYMIIQNPQHFVFSEYNFLKQSLIINYKIFKL